MNRFVKLKSDLAVDLTQHRKVRGRVDVVSPHKPQIFHRNFKPVQDKRNLFVVAGIVTVQTTM